MNNYKLLEKKLFKKDEVFLYQHEKSGAKITYVKCDDKNKTFAVAFKTHPENSFGSAHIMEHSVLNGSEKFRTKEPFMDLVSSSMASFLNAMTYPDKTVYPVSSEVDQDFYNLVRVYLDAVFAPRVLEKEEIFLQEGRHYFFNEEGKLDISGVVYNEMKGALSNPDQIVSTKIDSLLFKGSPFEYVSGGDPREIPNLTYEDFKKFYADHYSPSKAYIYFYGDLDIDFYLDYLDREYLSKGERSEETFSYEIKENVYEEPIFDFYPVGGAKGEKSDYLTYSFLTGDSSDTLETLAIGIVSAVLFTFESSWIRQEILKEIKPEDFSAGPGYGDRTPITIQAKGADKRDLDKFIGIIKEGIQKAHEEGLDKEAIRAFFTQLEFSQKENLTSQYRGLSIFLMSRLDQPLEAFYLEDYIEKLRGLIETDYYDKLLEKYFLDNKTGLVYVASESEDLFKRLQEENETRLSAIQASLSEDEKRKIEEKETLLTAYQDREDTPEEKATLPSLKLDDLDLKVERLARTFEKDRFSFLYHDYDTQGLIYAGFLFNIDHLGLKEIQYAKLLAIFLGSVNTKNSSYKDLDTLITKLMGLNFTLKSFYDQEGCLKTYFEIDLKTSIANLSESLFTIHDLMENSLFDDKKRLEEILKMEKAGFENSMYANGHILVMGKNKASFDKKSFLSDQVSGFSYYLFLKDLLRDFDKDFESFKDTCLSVYKKLFTADLLVNITGDGANFSQVKEAILSEFEGLEEKAFEKTSFDFEPGAKKLAFLSDAEVNYVSKGANLLDLGLSYQGKISLAASIVSTPYLYSLVRAKGGAYGVGTNFDLSGNLTSYSYRDPNIRSTLEAFDSLPTYLEGLTLSEKDFENQKIASISAYLQPKSPAQKGKLDLERFMRGEDEKRAQEDLEDIRGASLSDLHKLADSFKKALACDNITVFGNRKLISDSGLSFDSCVDINA